MQSSRSLRSLLVVAAMGLAAAFTGSALAHGNNNNTVGAGASYGVQISAGSVTGSAGSYSEGSAVAASSVNGYGKSIQQSWGNTGGSASIGGNLTPSGAQVVTGTTQYANTYGYGEVSGNAPINVGESIANGNAAFGQTKVNAGGTAQYGTVGFAAVGAYQATQTYGGYGPR